MRNETGIYGENLACEALSQKKYSILYRNIRCLYGEIDIIAYKNHTLHFVEVKTRKSLRFGLPVESYTQKKREKIVRACFWILHESGLVFPSYQSFQFDFIGYILDQQNQVLECNWIENAWN